MNISTLHHDAERLIVRLEGRLDAQVADETRAALEALAPEGTARLVIDLSAVPFVDSSGLGALVAVLKAVRRRGGELRLAAPSEQARKLLKLTTLERVLPIADAQDTALGR